MIFYLSTSDTPGEVDVVPCWTYRKSKKNTKIYGVQPHDGDDRKPLGGWDSGRMCVVRPQYRIMSEILTPAKTPGWR